MIGKEIHNVRWQVSFALLFAFCMLVCADVIAISGVTDTVQRPKVALVLCGGGAKGAAHLGVLKVLEEVGIRPDMIVGTSIGGIVGGLYSMGYKASAIDSIVRFADWQYLLSNSTKRKNTSFV